MNDVGDFIASYVGCPCVLDFKQSMGLENAVSEFPHSAVFLFVFNSTSPSHPVGVGKK